MSLSGFDTGFNHLLQGISMVSVSYCHTGKCIRRFSGICAYCRYFIDHFLSIRHAHGDFCKHLGKDSSPNLDDRYSNLFLNAYINRHVHAQYLKMI